MKVCSRCQIKKAFDSFTKNGTASDGYYSMCKDCKRDSQYFSTYGIRQSDYDVMLEIQNGCCAICGIPEKHTEKKRLYVDHCHTNNHVRGLLCNNCNFVLGHAKDDTAVLENAILYLKETQYVG